MKIYTEKMKNTMNRMIKFRNNLAIMGLLLVAGLVSCTTSNNESEKIPRLPDQQQKQLQQNSLPEESVHNATTEITEPAQNNNNKQVMLNPPHGQPGHRCEIPVGAPLNTPEVQSDAETAAVASPSAAPTITNYSMTPTIENANRLNPTQTRNSTTPATGPKPTNNPPHGQPWHRCDIAVGSPLP